MSDDTDAARSVLAVIVVHERGLETTRPWAFVEAALARGALARALIYDNSAHSQLAASALPAGVDLVHDADNGGTAAAYAEASRRARTLGIPWLLLLDHDTDVPLDVLTQAELAIRHFPAARGPAAVLPRVCHGSVPISPARITRAGSIRPFRPGEQARVGDLLTGVASGALVHVDSLRALEPMPPGLWLDYVDHWMFVRLQEAGHLIAFSDALLQHDLSIVDPVTVSARRMASILDGEQILMRSLPWPARCVQPFRLLARALRLAPTVPPHALAVLSRLFRRAS